MTEVDVAADDPADEAAGRSTRTDALWADVRIDPVEIALPGGVGYTLRAYRPASEVGTPQIDRDEADELDDFEAASAAVARRRRVSDGDEDESAVADDTADDGVDAVRDRRRTRAKADEDEDEDLDNELDEDDEEDEEANLEDVPLFLGRKGRVYLFHNPEKLVEFIKSGAEHDMSELDTWADLVKRVKSEDIVPVEDDRYELDLVVENLRGGSDAWQAPLILRAGELARDLSYAMRLDTVVIAMASGSPLDDLDEALRAADSGGVGAFFAKRKLRKIPAQQSSLAWRTVIGKISAVSDWRD
jgi:hypothetical protein